MRYSYSILGNHQNPEANRTRQWVRTLGPTSVRAGNKIHHCAVAYLSDCYILDAPARLFGVKLGYGMQDRVDGDSKPPDLGALGDAELKSMVTLSHNINIHYPLDFRADEWMYLEIESEWETEGRVLIRSRFFTRSGILIATCTQEVRAHINL
jgi:acyl-CoA thioesterase